jgi:hypothetical protein
VYEQWELPSNEHSKIQAGGDKKVVIIVMAEILDVIHCLRLKNPTTFWRLDLPTS